MADYKHLPPVRAAKAILAKAGIRGIKVIDTHREEITISGRWISVDLLWDQGEFFLDPCGPSMTVSGPTTDGINEREYKAQIAEEEKLLNRAGRVLGGYSNLVKEAKRLTDEYWEGMIETEARRAAQAASV